MTKNWRKSIKFLENEKSFLKWNKIYFLSFLKDFQLTKLVSDLIGEYYVVFIRKDHHLLMKSLAKIV